MKFKLKPSRRAYLLLVITIFLFFAASNVQGGWLYIIDSLLISLLFFSAIIPITQIKRLKITRNFNNTVYENENLKVDIVIENISKKTVSFIEVSDYQLKRIVGKTLFLKNKEKENSKFFVEIPSKDKISFAYTLIPKIRGLYVFEKFDINSYGPFGLFLYSKELKIKDELIVLPNVPLVKNLPLENFKGSGIKYSNKTIRSTEATLPYNIREYKNGDNKKLIHWKTTARANKLMVKELESEQFLNVKILLDTKKGNNIGLEEESNLEYMIKISAGIFKMCINKGCKVELLYFDGDKLNRLTETIQLKQILESFARIDTNTNNNLCDLLIDEEVTSSNNILIPFFLYPNENDISTLFKLFQKNFTVIPVFSDISSFDKNYKSPKNIISKWNDLYFTIEKGKYSIK